MIANSKTTNVRRCSWVILGIPTFLLSLQNADAIDYGKRLTPNEHPAVGKVVILDVNQRILGHGTGTLIAPDIVLTAAHVIASVQSPHLIVFQMDHAPDQPIRGVSYRVHHRFFDSYNVTSTDRKDTEFLGTKSTIIANDIALVKLSTPVRSVRSFPSLGRSIPSQGAEVIAIGYGRDETNTSASAALRLQGTVRVHGEKDNFVTLVTTSERGQQARKGDSGGPILTSTGEIVAIVQGGSRWATMDGYDFDEYGYFVSIPYQTDWLNSNMDELRKQPQTPNTSLYLQRGDVNASNMSLTLKQFEALLQVRTPLDRLMPQLLRRGICEPLTPPFIRWFEEVGAPDSQILKVTRN